ncbi:MAG TPA: GtrA family protein [Acidimicrobiales bacterium]|nr:GtrA family protein [Acidimicrobiales bacterium]
MPGLVSSFKERALSPGGRKAIKYTLVSVIAVAVSQIALVAFGPLLLDWKPRSANIAASSIGAVPSYYLNRYWAWGKRGRSHLLKEVAPFWALAFLGMAFSTWTVGITAAFASDRYDSELIQAMFINGGSIAAFGVLWIAKFIIFNKILFKAHPEELEDAPALDGRTGIPT